MITYHTGDATEPIGDGRKIIVHVNNNLGGWGKGFVLALSKKWDAPERCYREWARTGRWEDGDHGSALFGLGQIQAVRVSDDITVCNMVAQDGYYPKTRPPYVRYDALRECLASVARVANGTMESPSVHMPRIGCGLAGGEWSKVEPIIQSTLVAAGLLVFVYDLP